MLDALHIQNYALIDRLEVALSPGFNALTGETGAGKSIVVGALNLVLGARASADLVRTGADAARVEAAFSLDRPSARLRALLAEHDIPLEDGVLILARTVLADGRSKAFAGGRMVPVAVLAALGDELVDLHGQHEHQSLLRPDLQREVLDAYAGAGARAEAVAEKVTLLHALVREIAAVESDDRDTARRMEFLRHEIGEIDAAGLQPGEEEELRSRLNRIIHAEKLRGLSESAYAALYEGESPSAVDLLDRALSGIAELGGISAEFLELSAPLHEARAQVEAVAETLRGNLSDTEYDPAELDALHRRQGVINDLKRKYGADIAEILAYRGRAAAELAGYDSRDARLAELRGQEARLRGEATEAANALSAVRRKAAAALDRKIAETLRDLDMKGARFETRFTDIPLCAHGVDGVEFLLSANAGEKPKPLRAVASGGEMSRIMLALKSVFAGMDRIPTLVFDEIDAGVGGVVARRVSEKMAALAASHQVLCISHLPQIAAAADAHYVVEKQVRRGVTATAVARVDGEARERELARLLDGSLSDVSLEHARALLRDMGSTK